MGTLVETSTPTSKMTNPYLEAYERDKALWNGDSLQGACEMFTRRSEMVREYSWAIPNREAIEALLSFGEVVELGAGSGYWAHLVQEAGGSITPWDLYPGEKNKYTSRTWTPVAEGSVEVLENSPARTLMLSWPPYESHFAQKALRAFKGLNLIYVGEGGGGCCANDEFFEQLEAEWLLEKTIAIPRWPGIQDRFQVWKKR